MSFHINIVPLHFRDALAAKTQRHYDRFYHNNIELVFPVLIKVSFARSRTFAFLLDIWHIC